MDKPDERLAPGQIVLSRKGKDRGNFYVVVGFQGEDRLALADAGRFNLSRPKKKNPRHVQPTSRHSSELRDLIQQGRDIDHGRFCQILAGLRLKPEPGKEAKNASD